MLKHKSTLRLKKTVKVKRANPDKSLTSDFIGSAIMECFLNNDPEGVMELLKIYLDEQNKVKFLNDADISRSTVYQALRHKNPTIKTIAKLISSASASSK